MHGIRQGWAVRIFTARHHAQLLYDRKESKGRFQINQVNNKKITKHFTAYP